jgi:chloride channel protein, CIC family
VLFALEIMMHEVSARTLVPVAIATATATYVGRLFFGVHPSFVIPALEAPYFHLTSPLVLLAYVGLGLIVGVASALFIHSIYWTEDVFAQRVGGGYYRQHVLGMLLVGLTIYATFAASGHYYVEGVGYATVQDLLSGTRLPLAMLLALCALKLLVTALTLGSGASGGVFSPALFIGGTLGAAYGTVVSLLVPTVGVSVPAFAVAGMAGLVGGSTGAAMAAIVMIFEMTLDYNVIVPMTATVAISYGIRTVLSAGSIYTVKLRRRGHFTPDRLHANPHFVRQARHVMMANVDAIAASATVEEGARLLGEAPEHAGLLVTDPATAEVVGFLPRIDVLRAMLDGHHRPTVGELAIGNCPTVRETDSLLDVISTLRHRAATVALVANHRPPIGRKDVTGVITTAQLADALVETADLF